MRLLGDLFGAVVVPFMKLETEEDYEAIEELAGEVIDFFASPNFFIVL
jgi:sulfite reductase alpha subunit